MQPMLATAGPLPDGPGWAFELKWDGVRALADLGPAGTTLTSRLGNDVTDAYPELAGLAGLVGRAVLLDGEVVAMSGGRPSFAALQSRMHVREPAQARRLAVRTPVTYLVFDMLRLDGLDLTPLPYGRRRTALDSLGLTGPHWTVSPTFDDGPATLAAARVNGLEGVVAKRLGSPYRPGARSPDWVKVRFARRAEFVVGGWEHGEGNRAGGVGSLLLGYFRQAAGDDRLVYAGQVGTGFSLRTLADLSRRLAPLARGTAPFAAFPPDVRGRPVTWVEPRVVVEVGYAEWTPEGRLRFATYQRLRTDKDPREVHREQDG